MKSGVAQRMHSRKDVNVVLQDVLSLGEKFKREKLKIDIDDNRNRPGEVENSAYGPGSERNVQ